MAEALRNNPSDRYNLRANNAWALWGDVQALLNDTVAFEEISLVPGSNVDAIDITGTNMTTSSAIDIDMSASVSGQVIDIALDTADIAAAVDVIRITDSRDHDDAAADAYRGVTVENSGDFTGSFASTTYLLNGEYSGTVNGSAVLYAVRGDLSGATLTGGTYAAGYFGDGEAVVTLADGTQGINVVVDADTTGITIDRGTTDATAGSALSINFDVNSASLSAVDIDLDVATALSGVEASNGINVAVTSAAADADGTALTGVNITATNTASGRSDVSGAVIGLAGTLDSADTSNGLVIGFSDTLNNASATEYGVRVSCLDASHTHTDGTWYGLFVNNTSTVASGAAYGLGISQTLFNATTKGASISTTTAVDTALLMSSFDVTQVMTGASAVNMAEVAQFTLRSNVQVGDWANAVLGKIDFSTNGKVTGLAGVFCAEIDLPGSSTGGAGTYSCYEAEINCPASYEGNSPIHVFQINAWGASVTEFDDNGYLFDLTGVSSGAGSIWYDHQKAAPAVEEFIRVKTPSGVRYLALYDANS